MPSIFKRKPTKPAVIKRVFDMGPAIKANKKIFKGFYLNNCPICKESPLISAIYKGALECIKCGSHFGLKDGELEWDSEVCLLGIKNKGYLIVYHRDSWEEIE